MNMRILTLVLACFASAGALAGPDDPSRFDPVGYGAQNFLYDFNFAEPVHGLKALTFVRNHIRALKEHGDFENSRLVIVAHGNELHALSRLNSAAFPNAYEELRDLVEQGVEIHVCRNAASGRGYQPDEFYDLITVVPTAMTDIAKYQGEGFGYIYPAVSAGITRDDLIERHPELAF